MVDEIYNCPQYLRELINAEKNNIVDDSLKYVKTNHPWFISISDYIKTKSRTRGDLSILCSYLKTFILTIDDFHEFCFVVFIGLFHGYSDNDDGFKDIPLHYYLTLKVKIIKKITKHYYQIKGRMFPDDYGIYEPTKRKHNQI